MTRAAIPLTGRESIQRPPPPVHLPEYGFDLPFQESLSYYWERPQGMEHPRTIVELRMCAISNHIREEPGWWEKVKDETTIEKWREWALQQTGDDEHPEWKLTPRMVEYVLEELQGYANLRDPETGIEAGPADGIWRSDTLIPNSLRGGLLAAVTLLERVPDFAMDWQPGSDGIVLNLVDPSFYPVVDGRTIGRCPGSITTTVLRARTSDSPSKKFRRLPSDFFVGLDGKVSLTSPYINNIHQTRDKELYIIIPEILRCAVPVFEQVLSDVVQPIPPLGTAVSGYGGWNDKEAEGSSWENDIHRPGLFGENGGEQCYRLNPWTSIVRGGSNGNLWMMKDQISLRGRTLQVIVKLANIILTPQKPCYPGTAWCVEGIRDEKIVSTFIYHYDSENVGEGMLRFRRATSEPRCSHAHGVAKCLKALYNMEHDSNLVQEIGGVVVNTPRCVAFPNLYQHEAQQFSLEDPTKPGYTKLLAFFLVDPTRRIISTTDVPPQRREWVAEVLRSETGSRFAKLPVEIIMMILEENNETISRLEAEKYREEFIAERIVLEHDDAYFRKEYKMCRCRHCQD